MAVVKHIHIPAPRRQCRPATGLYFVESQCSELRIKIGVASNIKSRLGSMQVSSPYPLKLLKFVRGAAALEKELHTRFSADRVTGEWFRRSEELLEVIRSIDCDSDRPDDAQADKRPEYVPRPIVVTVREPAAREPEYADSVSDRMRQVAKVLDTWV